MSEAAKHESEAYIWRNARVLLVEVPVARETAAAWLPAPLEPAESPSASIFIADYPETAVGLVYREAGILLHARDGAGPARHCSWMVVDDDAALILGREMLGYPKKMAEISLVESGSGVVGSVRRKGTEIMRIEASLGAVRTGRLTSAAVMRSAGISRDSSHRRGCFSISAWCSAGGRYSSSNLGM